MLQCFDTLLICNGLFKWHKMNNNVQYLSLLASVQQFRKWNLKRNTLLKASSSEEKQKKVKEAGSPKRPMSAYMCERVNRERESWDISHWNLQEGWRIMETAGQRPERGQLH